MVPDLNVPQNLAGEVAAAAIQGIEETIAALRALAERIRTAASASPRDETAVDLANSTPAGQA
jgi:hypothetical protein